jgi:hypothetical protein
LAPFISISAVAGKAIGTISRWWQVHARATDGVFTTPGAIASVDVCEKRQEKHKQE